MTVSLRIYLVLWYKVINQLLWYQEVPQSYQEDKIAELHLLFCPNFYLQNPGVHFITFFPFESLKLRICVQSICIKHFNNTLHVWWQRGSYSTRRLLWGWTYQVILWFLSKLINTLWYPSTWNVSYTNKPARGNPSMLVVPPVSLYTHSVTFTVFECRKSYTYYINVVTECENIDRLVFSDDTSVAAWNRLTTDDQTMCCARSNVTSGYHSITHANQTARFFVSVLCHMQWCMLFILCVHCKRYYHCSRQVKLPTLFFPQFMLVTSINLFNVNDNVKNSSFENVSCM